jgi:hypothetical protein
MTSLPDETRNWFPEETQNAPGMEVGQPLVRLCWVIVVDDLIGFLNAREAERAGRTRQTHDKFANQ